MAFPSQVELILAIQQLKSYVELSDEDFNVVSTAALLLNIYAINETNTTVYPGDIPQTIYLDAGNNFTSVLYSRKYNTLLNDYVVTVLTLSGAVYVPVNPPDYILPATAPIVEDKYGLIEVEYEALVTTPQFTIGQQLSKIVIFVNGVPSAPVWVNNSTGLVLTTVPSLPIQAKPTSDYVESLLEVIKLSSESIDASTNQTKLNTNSLSTDLTTLIANTDAVITALSNLSTTDTTGNAKLDTLISSLSGVGINTSSIDSKLTNLSTVTSTTTALASKLEDIKTQLTTLQSSLTTLNSSTTDNNLVVTNIDTNIADINTELSTLSTKFTFQSGALVTNSSATTQPISATSLPLPTGAATQTTLALVKTNTDKLDVNLSTIPDTLAKESGGNLDAINTKLPTLITTANGLKVDGSAVTQPVSLTSLPLPSGAATAANQLDSIALETTIDSNINTIKNKLATGTLLVDGSAVTQPISVTSLPLPTGAATQTTLSNIDTNIDTLVNVDFSTAAGQSTTNTKLQTIVNALPDLATTALQTTGNASLTSIDGKLSGLATSSKQDTSNTLLTTISNKDFATEASLAAIKDAVLGNVNISESIWTDDSGTFFIRKVAFNEDANTELVSFKLFDGVTDYIPSTNPKPADRTLNITQPLTDTQLRASAVPVSGSFYPIIQDVNVSSLPLPVGAATSALQTAGNSSLTSIKTNLDSIVADVSNISSNSIDTAINTAAIVSTNNKLDTVNTNLDTINTSVETVNTSINTSINTTNSTLSTVNNKIPSGLTVTANKLIVDGSSVTQPISGTVNTGLSQPLTDTQLRATAVPVSGAFYQATQPVSVTTLPLPTGAATDASLSTVNTSVGSVKTSTDNLLTPINNIKTNLDSIVTSNSSIDSKLPSGLTVTSNKLLVDNSSVTQPVSGTVTVNNFVAPLTDTQLRATPVPVTMMSATTDIETVLLSINSVANVNIITGGSSYTNGSVVTFTGGTAITAAAGVIITSYTGAVIGINITNVGQYTVAPTGFSITGGGTGCTGSIIMGSTVELVTDNLSTVRGYISNDGADSVAFEVSLDGYNWSVTEVLNTNNNVILSVATSADYPLSFISNVAGTTKFRIRRTSIVNTITPRVFLNSSSDIAYIKTQNISSATTGLTDAQLRASPLALSTGAATSALQTTGNTSLSNIDTKTPALGQALASASTPVVLTASQLSTLTPLTTVATTQSGAWTVTANTGLAQPLTDTQLRASAVPVSGTFFQATQPVSATALPLPSGASTSALQTTGNNSLSSINTKTPALGQALDTGSVPVVLTAAQLSTLTPLTSVGRTWNLNSTTDGIAIGGTLPAFASTPTFNIGTAPTIAVTGTFFQAIQPISASALPLPTGAATETTLAALNAKNPALGQALAEGSVPVVLPAAQITTLTPPPAITGFALDTTVNSLLKPSSTLAAVTTVGSITNALPTGSNTIGAITNTTFAATQSGVWTVAGSGIFAISATSLPLPTNAATSALQTTGNNSLASIDAGIPTTLGITTAANSMPVVVASDQTLVTSLVAKTTVLGVASDVFADTTGALVVNTETRIATYSGAITGLIPPANPTDIFTISGSATHLIKIKTIRISATQTTTATRNIIILKRSTLNTGGTSTLLSKVPHDSTNPVSTATVRGYTANSTLGTLVGSIYSVRKIIGTVTTLIPSETIIKPDGQSYTLRSVNESICINLNGVSSAGNIFDISVTWIEIPI
jgi:hypothetical protein